MNRLIVPLTILASVVMAACQATATTSGHGASPSPPTGDVAGRYSRSDPANATLTIAPRGSDYTLSISAAGLPAGAATAADCNLVAAGPLRDGRIVGTLIRDEDSAYDPLPGDEEDHVATITAILSSGGATIEEQGASSRYCGMGSDLTGSYVRE